MTADALSGERRLGFPWLLLVVTIPALVVLILLGTWQMQRLAWKEDLLATIDARLASAPITIDELAARANGGTDIRYQPVTVEGVFDHSGEQHFFATLRGASGYFLYTPLVMADGHTVLINRGFVPFDLKDASLRLEGQIAGDVSISGLARERLAEKPSFVVPDNDPGQNIYYWKDWEAMVAEAGLDRDRVLPFFIDANDAPVPGGWPVGGVTRIDLPNNHLQYAITWYGLAAVLVIIVGLFILRRMRGVPPKRHAGSS